MPVKHDWNKLLTAEEQRKAREAISKLDRKYPITWERSGTERYSELDSRKDPFSDTMSGTKDENFDIITDGYYTLGSRTKTDNGSLQNYKVTDYAYIIKIKELRDLNGILVGKVQTVVTKKYQFQLFMKELMSIPF